MKRGVSGHNSLAREVAFLESERPRTETRTRRKRSPAAAPLANDWKALVLRSRDSPSLAPRRERAESAEHRDPKPGPANQKRTPKPKPTT